MHLCALYSIIQTIILGVSFDVLLVSRTGLMHFATCFTFQKSAKVAKDTTIFFAQQQSIWEAAFGGNQQWPHLFPVDR